MANGSERRSGSAALSEVPALHSFEFDKNAIGNIKSSVNKFRGSVSLPLDFMTLPGLEGLDVKLSVLYSSNIRKNLDTWNTEAPTGILGLGWQMPIEMIVADKGGSASPTSDRYYLLSGGTANPMVKTGETADGKWVFQLRNFQFWSVQYDPVQKVWVIVKEDGIVYTYGAGKDSGSNATQWGISWGNWIGSSNQGAAQVQYPLAWNLASIVTPLGSSVQYEYLNVNQKLINSSVEYTQASYLKKVTDSYGRTITFHYGDKFGFLNPGTSPDGKPLIEYQPQHTQIVAPAGNAYQDRYETYFLDQVTITDPDGSPMTGLKFTYAFINNAPTSDSNYALMYKRCLQSVFQYAPDGETLPAMNFEYFPANASSIHPGALQAVVYPEGGRALFEYKNQTITSVNGSKKIQVTNPVAGSLPRVWFGADYVVFTYQSAGSIQVTVQSWNGQWVSQHTTISKSALQDSLQVLTAEHFFALFFRNKTTGNDELYLFRNDDRGQELQFGKWVMYNNQPFVLALKPNAGSSVFVGGDSFVVAYNKDYTANRIQGFSYTWQDGRWNAATPPPVPPSADCELAAITAFQNFYIASCYLPGTKQLRNYLFYRLAEGMWKAATVWTVNNIDIAIDTAANIPYLAITPMATGMALTYVTQITGSSVSYRLDLYNWNEQFFVLNTASPATANLSSPITGGKSLYALFQTLVAGATVNNNLALLRNKGGSQQQGSVWSQAAFKTPGSTSALNLALGEDMALLSPASGATANQQAVFNPNNGSWELTNGPAGSNPSIAGNYMTVGKSIYFRDTNGNWKPLPLQLSDFNYPESLQNRAPKYLAYQSTADSAAAAYVVALKNGNALPAQKLGGVKIYVTEQQPGTALVSGRFLVTYPASAASFNAAPSMDLWNLDEVNFSQVVTDTPVAYVVIEDAYDLASSYTQSFYYANSAESQIVYNGLLGVAQYPLVMVVPGIKEKSGTPTATPEGFSQFFYSNGLAKQTTLYPEGGLQNYQHILNGILLGQKDFDKDKNLVSSQLDYWTVYSKDAASRNLYGGYARCEKSTTMKDGVVQRSAAGYDLSTGVMCWQEKSYYDAYGTEKNKRTETLYAYQVAGYAAVFNKLHLYTAVAMTTESVAPADRSYRRYVKSEATTYRNWRNPDAVTIDCSGNENCLLAAYEVFTWTTPGDAAPVFPASAAPSAPWQLKTRICFRTDRHYLIREQVESSGLVSSFLYDQDQTSLVAKFPNGSLSGGEVSYYGFEAYESDQGWQLGRGAAVIPDSNYPETDAHTGLRSLRIAAATTGANGIRKVFDPARKDQSYLFSAWVKKPVGFRKEAGDASWKITVNGGDAFTLRFPDIAGQWVYVAQEIPLAGAGSIDIYCENQNPESAVLADNLRFTPLACMVEAYGYDQVLQRPSVILGSNGETSRRVANLFQQEILSTNPADRTSKIGHQYLSRKGNEGRFATADPNQALTITGADGGVLTTFTKGEEWRNVWQPEADTWIVKDAVLSQKEAGLAGWLQYTGTNQTNYTLDVAFALLEAPVTPLGIRLGNSLTVQWNPGTMAWELLDEARGQVIASVDLKAFVLPTLPFEAQLQKGVVSTALSEAFAGAGYLLSTAAKVRTGPAAVSWIITDPDTACCYMLKVNGVQMAVYTLNGRWTLFAGEETLAFWTGGKLVFSYAAAAPLSALPKLFFGNRVAIARITTAINPMAEIAFDDSRGLNIQNQQYTVSRMVVAQSVPDPMGRMAVKTKPAYIPASQNAMFSYCQAFAKMDWVTGTMSGLVSVAYPIDAGYPFARQTFEKAPSSRVIQEAVPGALFRVDGGKCTRYRYGAATGSAKTLGFFKKTVEDPNGNVFYELGTLLDQVICHVAVVSDKEVRNETYYDDAGNAILTRSPNYFAVPEHSAPGNWETTQTFDFANRLLVSQQGGKLSSRFIYDRGGNLRFAQDAEGAVAGTVNYTKYDVLARPIETGYYTGTWDQQQLQQYADADPAWPQNSPTWRTKNRYDADAPASNAIGRIAGMQANNGTAGLADVTETLRYDLLGNTIKDTLTVNAFDATARQVAYEYNEVGTITAIFYPADVYAYSVHYQLNPLSQIIRITDRVQTGTSGVPEEHVLAAFSYDAIGNPQENSLLLQNNATVRQQYRFNSPNWLTDIRNQKPDGTNLLQQTLTYTEGGYAGAGYFDGSIASSSLSTGHDTAVEDGAVYAYDPIGQMAYSGYSDGAPAGSAAQTAYQYDANGNILSFPGKDAAYTYTYNPGTQQIGTIATDKDSQPVVQFGYDHNGNVTQLQAVASGISRSRTLTIGYNPATRLATQITATAPDVVTLAFAYGCRNERVLKQVNGGTGKTGKKLYLRGTSAMPLQELAETTDGSGSLPVNYVYGPGGLIAMRKFRNETPELLYVLKDHLGSTRAILNLAGDIVASYQYLAFGALSEVNEPVPVFMPYLYTGQEYEAEIGLYNYRARFYDAGIGRFIAIDPARQYFSPYLYASNNPVLFIDPSGMFSIKSFFSAVAGIVIGAAEILVGVVIDAVAAAVAVLTGGLGTGASIALGALSGVFYGAGVSAITYSVFNFNDFSWKDYGIQMGIGALTGALSGGFGAAVGIAAKATQATLTELAATTRAVGGLLDFVGETGAATVVRGGAWVAEKGSSLAGLATNGPVKAGWVGLAKGITIGVVKSEVIGNTINIVKNTATGNAWDTGMGKVIFSSALSGSIGGLQVSNRIRYGEE